MDNDLKKLSRLELLEILVSISEENEALSAENIRLRHELASKSNTQRATKVGSIAELAMQTNGFFEAAQNAADDYLREIKRMRDQLAARTAAQPAVPQVSTASQQMEAQREAESTIEEAQARAKVIVRRANLQADSILADAKAKSDATIAEANRQSQAIVARANQKADAMMNAAHAEAARQNRAKASRTVASPDKSGPIRGRHVRFAAEA